MVRAQMYLLYLPLYVVFGVVGAADYSLWWTNDWQLAHGPSWERQSSTHLQWWCLMSCMNGVVFLPVLRAEQMLFLFIYFLLVCNSPLLLGVLTHGGLVAHQNKTSPTYIVRGTSWCKRTSSLCWLSHPGLELFAVFGPYMLKYIHIWNILAPVAVIDTDWYWLLTILVHSALIWCCYTTLTT